MASDTFEHCLKTLGVGCAIVDPANWHILFENALFFQWFPPEAADPDSLTTRIPDLNTERAEARFAKGRSQLIELDVQQGARKRSLQLELRREAANGGDFVVVECRDISKQMEAEYMLDSYSRMSEKHTRELQKEKDRVEKLLLNIMPRSVYEEMRDFGTSTPQRFDQASVLMLDFVGFTSMAVSRDPSALIAELNDIFSAFDRIAELFGCERIKTIGDAYVAVSGLPESTPDHAANIAKVALRMRRYLEKRNAAHPTHWTCRKPNWTGS